MRTSSSRRGKLNYSFKEFLLLLFLVASWSVVVAHQHSATSSSSSNGMLKHWKWFNGRVETLVFVSKRRVPNGPDPIHNRSFQRTVKTREPPSAKKIKS